MFGNINQHIYLNSIYILHTYTYNTMQYYGMFKNMVNKKNKSTISLLCNSTFSNSLNFFVAPLF